MTEPLDASTSPRFAQVATYARLPLRRDIGSAKSVFLGIPWDDATSYRSGAREGPSAIRTASRLVRSYNMFAGVYPFRVLDTVDAGDVDPVPGYTEDTFQRIESALTPIFAAGVVPFVAGGDHSVTLPILRAHHLARKEAVSLLHFDAHFDTWEAYWGSKRYTHGTWVRRAYEEGLIRRGQVFQVGIRSPVYSADDVTNTAAIVERTFTTEDVDVQGYRPIVDRILKAVGDAPLYVSVDIDVLDPAYAPGTGTPEAGGLTSREMIHFIRALHPANLVGFDLVEVAPQYDHTGQVTALAASHLIYEGMCALARHRSRDATS
ncbi:MAG: agmatinase [Thermoplasmata archaeon]|nr:agmatinase [Thermoplasmata archaeon]